MIKFFRRQVVRPLHIPHTLIEERTDEERTRGIIVEEEKSAATHDRLVIRYLKHEAKWTTRIRYIWQSLRQRVMRLR